MFQKRLSSALCMKSSIKVRKQKLINAFKRELTIASVYYSVVLTSIPHAHVLIMKEMYQKYTVSI